MTIFPSLRNFGGFFSDYYFTTVFSRSVAGRQKTVTNAQTDLAFRIFKRLHERAETRSHDVGEVRDAFARPLLRDAFGYYVGISDSNIYPLFASAEKEAAATPPLLLAYLGSWDAELDKGTKGKPSPMKQLRDALASNNYAIRYGVLLTGETLRLVRAGGDGPRNAYLQLDLEECLDREDRESFAAAWRIFASGNFISLQDGKLPIDAIEGESRDYAQRVSDDLKGAVFASAETLVQALLEDWRAREPATRELGKLSSAALAAFRDAALTCLYRLLFVLYAEARDEHLLGHPLYRDSYSLAGLLRELVGGRDLPSGNRYGYWKRLLAMFAIHYGGLPTSGGLDPIPPRGGSLLDPRTEPGTILEEARLDDAAVARLVLQLTTTLPRRGVGLERVSFRELDIEQLGAVYEGLLEYEPKVAAETLVEVKIQGKTYALKIPELVRLCDEKDMAVRGDPSLVAGTDAARLHSEPSASTESAELDDDESESSADGGEPGESDGGLKKGSAATLLRRLQPGTFHFVPGPARKGSGSFYTPLPLVEDLVRHALSPLVEAKTATRIERLRILDPACGSAHFLVEAMRFIGRALHRAYSKEHDGKPPPHFRGTWDNDFEVSDQVARTSGSEARAWCKRRIAERCLFGVDLNPTAVQLAQVSLWIESLAADRPLSYFEHHVRCGNSLVGSWLERISDPPLPDMKPKARPGELDIFAHDVKQRIREAAKIRALIDFGGDAGAVEPESINEQTYKADRSKEAEALLAAARLLFDLRSASAFLPQIWQEWPTLCGFASNAVQLETYISGRPWWGAFKQIQESDRFFHWELEFPEVLLDGQAGGFDAVLGNPPWDKIKPNKDEFYARYDVLIRAYVGGEMDRRIRQLQRELPGLDQEFTKYEYRIKTTAQLLKHGGDYAFQDWEIDGNRTGGDPDIFKFFLERDHNLLPPGGRAGLVVPSALYNNEGCTGLRHLVLEHADIERFYGFENRNKIFPIDSRYKFVNLVFRKGTPERDGFEAAFMRTDLDEIADPGRKPWMVIIKRTEIERLSPGTLAFLEYRDASDREIILKMYGYDAEANPIKPRPLLGAQGAGTWDAHFYREFDMTNDRDLWTNMKTGTLYNPLQILGPIPGTTNQPPFYNAAAWPVIRSRMAENGFWPLYEGKQIDQFMVDTKPIERWVNLATAQQTKRGPRPNRKLVFRAIGRNTDARTLIAAVLPENSCFANSLWGAILDPDDADRLCTVLNSFAADFAIRLRVSANLNFTHVGRLAVLTPQESKRVAALTTQSAYSRPAPQGSDARRWRMIVTANGTVASAFGLDADQLSRLLNSFPVFERKNPEFFAYLKAEVLAWKNGEPERLLIDRQAASVPRIS